MDNRVTWGFGSYPPAGLYRLFLSDGRVMVRPMFPDWVWDDTFGGAYIDAAERIDEALAHHEGGA